MLGMQALEVELQLLQLLLLLLLLLLQQLLESMVPGAP